MHINLQVYDDDGVGISNGWRYNPLELVEKGIELFKETGGKVGYKVPKKGDAFLSYSAINARITKATESFATPHPDYTRLTFTPPKPEPVESEWEELRKDLKCNPSYVVPPDMLRLMDEIDRRCPGGGGKNAGA